MNFNEIIFINKVANESDCKTPHGNKVAPWMVSSEFNMEQTYGIGTYMVNQKKT